LLSWIKITATLSWLALLPALAVAAPTPQPALAVADTPEAKALPADEIFWEDPEHRSALFISERLLNEWPWDRLAIHPDRRKELEERIAAPLGMQFYFPNRPYPECTTDLHTGVGPPLRQAVSLVDFVRREPVALVGRVLRITPGWNVLYSSASSIVELQVEEIIKAPKGGPAVGEHVFYEQKRGSILVRGRRLCTEAQPGEESHRAGLGELLFLTGFGRSSTQDPRLFPGAVWPISGNEIEPQPYKAIAEPRLPISVPQLRLSLEQRLDDEP
jgi:hypothetical protein